jgi:Dihaem cytochrome c
MMKTIPRWIIVLSALILATNGIFYTASADHDRHRDRKRYQKQVNGNDNNRHRQERNRKSSGHDGSREMNPVNNPIYQETCGACHFPYQPELLPAGSWEKICTGLDNHFDEAIELEPESKKVIIEYLKANAADRSSVEEAVKIVRSLRDQTPLRITEIPYIQRKHHEIKAEVLERESIGSLSNCPACHQTAESGDYDDEHAVIPQ